MLFRSASLVSGAKAASEGNVLGALTGLAGGIGAIPGAEIPGMDTLKTVGNAAKTVSALTSGDPLQILGAAANLSGNEDLATASKVANTAALAKAAISGDPNAILKLATTYGSDVGEVIKGAVGAGAGDMTGGEADERKGASDTYNTLANLPDGKATANAVDTILKGQNTSVGTGEDLTGGISGEDLNTLLGSGVLGVGTGADTSVGGEGADTSVGAGGADTVKRGGSTSSDVIDQLAAAGLDAGTEGTSTGVNTGVGTGADTVEGGEGIEGADLTEGEAEERKGVADVNDLLASLGYTSTSGEDEDRRSVSDVLADLTGGEMTDREAEDRAATKEIIDTFGYTPGTTGAGRGGGGGGTTSKPTTKTTTTTPPPPAQSGMDIGTLLALMSMMGGEQQQAPQQQLMNLAGVRSVEDIFGPQPQSLADILRRRA